jgi:heme/copper-type cytochrome/quinol oxidase subunit 2
MMMMMIVVVVVVMMMMMICLFNSMKSRVDTLDMKYGSYSAKWQTR